MGTCVCCTLLYPVASLRLGKVDAVVLLPSPVSSVLFCASAMVPEGLYDNARATKSSRPGGITIGSIAVGNV